MSSPILEPGGAMERMQAWKGKIDKLAADTKSMSDRFQALEMTARDRDGMVVVTVDSAGSVVNLQLTHLIEGVEPSVLARTIMSTIRAAKAKLAEESQEIIEETLGETPAAQAISESVSRQLRGPSDDDDDDRGPGDEDDADELTWRN